MFQAECLSPVMLSGSECSDYAAGSGADTGQYAAADNESALLIAFRDNLVSDRAPHAADGHRTSPANSEVTGAELLVDGQAHTPPSLAAWNGSACSAAHAWKGVSCEGGHVTALNLSGLNIEGKEHEAYTARQEGDV